MGTSLHLRVEVVPNDDSASLECTGYTAEGAGSQMGTKNKER